MEGAVAIVDDATFNGCLELKGGSLTLPALEPEDIAGGVTILMWIKHDSAWEATGNVLNLDRFGTGLSSHAYRVRRSGTNLSAGPIPAESACLYFAPDSWVMVPRDTWVPLAVSWGVVDGRFAVGLHARSYDSNCVLTYDLQSPTAQALLGKSGGLTGVPPVIACTPPADRPHYPGRQWQFMNPDLSRGFRGRIAQLRIYQGMLDAQAIEAVFRRDVAQDTDASQGLPIDFSFENEEAAPTLFIDTLSGGHSMLLRATSQLAMHLRTEQAAASAQHWHFRLLFRPGTLADLNSISIATAGFSLARHSTVELDTLYLLATRPVDGTAIDIDLRGIVADGRQGTRLTRMQIDYQNVKFDGIDVPLKGQATQHLNLINHHGRRDVPVHVAIAGPNRISIGRTANLRVHVTNTLPSAPRPGRSNALTFGKGSRLCLSFDDRDGTDWSLARPDSMRGISVRWAQGRTSDASPLAPREVEDGNEFRWVIPLEGITLQPLERIELMLLDVPAQGPEGHSNAYVDLINNPGYWDARFACAIDKVAPVATPQWQALPLEKGWQVGNGSPPEYLKDANGVVHLRGECFFPDVGRAYFKPYGGLAFRLPEDVMPAKPLRLFGKTHIIRSHSRPVAYGADILTNVYIVGVWETAAPGHGIPLDEIDAQDARLYLDGISFVARQR